LSVLDETCDCPHCGSPCDRDQVDVDVGVIYGPWGCANCGWSSNPEYDSRGGIRHDGADRVFDQYGGSHHVERLSGKAVLAGVNLNERGAGHE
jgi:transcription elongation factor Elf1